MDSKEISVDFTQNSKVVKLMSMTPILISDDNENHIVVFKRMLELMMSQGRWMGWFPQVS